MKTMQLTYHQVEKISIEPSQAMRGIVILTFSTPHETHQILCVGNCPAGVAILPEITLTEGLNINFFPKKVSNDN